MLLTAVIALSGLQSHTSLTATIVALRTPVVVVIVAQFAINGLANCSQASYLTLVRPVAAIQLPVVIMQWITYDFWPSGLRGSIIFVDAGFGTFAAKTDYAVGFFLTILLALELSDRGDKSVWKSIWLLYLSVTIIVIRAEISVLGMVVVFAIHFFARLRLARLLGTLIAASVIIILIYGSWGSLPKQASEPIQMATSTLFLDDSEQQVAIADYLANRQYSRVGGFAYLRSNGISLLGAGPGAYGSPISGGYKRANYGHLLTYASELGILGLATSVGLMIAISFAGRSRNLVGVSILACLVIWSITVNVLNDVAVLMAATSAAVVSQRVGRADRRVAGQ